MLFSEDADAAIQDADLDEIGQLIRQAEGKLGEVREAAASALAQEKALQRETLAALVLAQDWDGRAENALREGHEDVARGMETAPTKKRYPSCAGEEENKNPGFGEQPAETWVSMSSA